MLGTELRQPTSRLVNPGAGAGLPRTLRRIAKARARARAHVWKLIGARPGGFPWPEIAGRTLKNWQVIDIDATLVTASSDKEGAAPT